MGELSGLEPALIYLPFMSGEYRMLPGLTHLTLDPDDPQRRLIQIDDAYEEYRANKRHCRAHLTDYYGHAELPDSTLSAAQATLVNHLCASYPRYFYWRQPGQLHCALSGETFTISPEGEGPTPAGYASLFDALVSQIQEDVALWQLQGDRDWLAALHVCAPNGWVPREKLGLSFDAVHRPVPEMERQRAQVLPLLKGLIYKPAFMRFVWDLRTDGGLNHHPERGVNEPFVPGQTPLYVRVERQLLVGMPQVQAVLFMIRTYRYPVGQLSQPQREKLAQAVAGMSPQVRAYKRLEQNTAMLLAWLTEGSNTAL